MNTAHPYKSRSRFWLSILILLFPASPLLPAQDTASALSPAAKETSTRNALAKGQMKSTFTGQDAEARTRFLKVEQFARLPENQRVTQFAEFYRTLAPFYMNSAIEMILSSCPADILNRQAGAPPGGNPHARWAAQLDQASATLSPEQVADKLGSRLWLDVAGRTRTRQILQRHRELLDRIIREDLAANEPTRIQRGCTMVSDLRLRQFTTNILELYLANTPNSEPARIALVWLADPATLGPLLKEIEKDPKSIKHHAGLFQGPLAGQPAEPTLLNLLDSPDPDLRYHAAYALYECRDPALAGPIAKLAQGKEVHLQSAALMLALRLPDQAFGQARSPLLPLLQSPDPTIQLQAVTCFARHKDLAVGSSILNLLQQPHMDPGQAVTVMQALSALTDSTFNYNMHDWGPQANGKAIARFQMWLGAHPMIQ